MVVVKLVVQKSFKYFDWIIPSVAYGQKNIGLVKGLKVGGGAKRELIIDD